MRDQALAALVCLDLQQGRWARAPDGEQVAGACRGILADARRRGWPVLHVHGREPGAGDVRAICGLEPRPNEAVYVRFGPSAFSNRNFTEAVLALGGPLALIGFDLPGSVLATAYGAADRGLQVEVIRDAVACGGRDDLAALIYAPLQALAPQLRVLTSHELLDAGTPRFAAANLP
jgi:nicotinamidase-related amidase